MTEPTTATPPHDSTASAPRPDGRAPGPTPLLRAERLSKDYPNGNVHALADVNVSIAAGEYVAIMGPSGSGKSTLLNLLGALDRPTSGEVYFDDQPLSTLRHLDRFRSREIGFVFQSFFLLPTLTSLQNVQIPMFEGTLSARQREQRALELLEQVNMAHRAGHRPAQLSVGERQRVAIARSLANGPRLLLADEPTGNLDSRTGEEILQLFDRLHREGRMTLVVVTHSDEVAARAQRVLRMRDGRLAEDRLNPQEPRS
ncbi:MAG: ABC transporter ATP-binding protein [Pirellulales bacterium]|nr:ABC transporter ATP-binding protein [Pirellulales bacterium]